MELKAIRDGIGEALVELGKRDDRVVVLTADVKESVRVERFAQQMQQAQAKKYLTKSQRQKLKAKEEAKKLALKYWPGPLTLVLPFKYCKWQGHCDDYLALRISNHPFASDLVCSFGHPIVSTSANISEKGDCYDPEKIKEQFEAEKFKPDLFISAGKLPIKLPSTIVKFDKEAKILRQGEIKVDI